MTSQVLQTAWSQESLRTKANYFTGDYMNTSAHKHLYILHTFPDTCIYHAHRIECVICIAVLERLLFFVCTWVNCRSYWYAALQKVFFNIGWSRFDHIHKIYLVFL